MADGKGKKKRGGRRAYLNDFKVGADGEYSYKGLVHSYTGTLPYNKVKLRIGIYAGIMTLAAVLAGVLPAPSMVMGSGNLYVVPCFIIELIAVFITAWSVVRLLCNGSELRDYVFKATVPRIPVGAIAVFIAAILCVAANVLYIILNGFGGKTALSCAVPLLHGAVCACAWLLRSLVLSLPWEQTMKDTEAAGFSAAFGEEAEQK